MQKEAYAYVATGYCWKGWYLKDYTTLRKEKSIPLLYSLSLSLWTFLWLTCPHEKEKPEPQNRDPNESFTHIFLDGETKNTNRFQSTINKKSLMNLD